MTKKSQNKDNTPIRCDTTNEIVLTRRQIQIRITIFAIIAAILIYLIKEIGTDAIIEWTTQQMSEVIGIS